MKPLQPLAGQGANDAGLPQRWWRSPAATTTPTFADLPRDLGAQPSDADVAER